MEKINYSFFIDFDGTITLTDVCKALVTSFAREGWQDINRRWENNELTTMECARQTFRLFKTNDPDDFISLLDNIVIDPGFRDFTAFCRNKEYPAVILSDGYDFYIEHLLKREGIDLPYYANKMIFHPRLDIIAPYSADSCDLCGVCKLELMAKLRRPEQTIVYIGDGYSDFCPAQRADLVFAKPRLYDHCLKVGKEARRFNSFSDILNQLKT